MDNVLKYIDDYGNIPFSEKPLNEIDGLVFCVMSYADFSGIVPMMSYDGIKTKSAVKLYFKNKRTRVEELNRNFIDDIRKLLVKCADSVRFGNLRLKSFYCMTDSHKKEQFAALAIEYDKNNTFIAFRGTDNTIVGWQEDFQMSYKHIPAQIEALDFLERFLFNWEGNVVLGGHSKGGNLAMYASIMCKESSKRVQAVYNYDGPGLSKALIENSEFPELKKKMQAYIPQFSVVGMLFEHDYNAIVIRSDANGFKQHNPINWVVKKGTFVREKNVAVSSTVFENTMKEWLLGMDDKSKKEFTNIMFGIMERNGYTTFKDVADNKGNFVTDYIKALTRLNENNSRVFHKTVGDFIKMGIKSIGKKAVGIKYS